MADNYLERKMEEHRQGAPSRPQRKSPAGNRPGTLTISFPRRRVAVTGTDIFGEAVIRAFANAGCRVAFCDPDRRAGSALAQSSGACFFPVADRSAASMMAFTNGVIDRFGAIDILVDTSASTASARNVINRHDRGEGALHIICVTTGTHAESSVDAVAAEADRAGAVVRTISVTPDPSVDPLTRARSIAGLCLFLTTETASIIAEDTIKVK